MLSRSLVIAALLLSAGCYVEAQLVTSQRATIGMTARVAPVLKVRAATPFVKNEDAEIAVMSRGESEMEIVASIGRDATDVEIPVSVTTNLKSFLFRIASVSGPANGQISLSSSSRNLPIENSRVFGLVSAASPVNGRIESLRLHFNPAADGQKREVSLVVQAVSTQSTQGSSI
jgi:hypothetical protein